MEHLIFHSFDEYAAAIQHADIRVTLSSRQQTNWALDFLSLGDMSVHWGQDAGPNVVEGSSSAGGLTLFVPQYNADAIVGNSVRMDSGSVMLLEPGSEFCMASTSVNRWSSIFVPHDELTALGIAVEEARGTQSVLAPTENGKRLRMLIENLGVAARSLPDGFLSTSAATIARAKIAEAVGAVLGFQNEPPISQGRRMLSRTEITRTALRILDEHVHEHISVYRLASLMGISERTLRTAFENYFGISPARYLKLRTLHRARSILKWSDPDVVNVTEVAVGLGIWELGRFSHDYKMLFDELPSETLRLS